MYEVWIVRHRKSHMPVEQGFTSKVAAEQYLLSREDKDEYLVERWGVLNLEQVKDIFPLED